ncbi:MAG: ABC transporter ATP-binding protein [Acutalibacteraceae bacterium]|nr:ABC transporter ATP-binding protein [Acutalibacteraceae bacterium]
MIKTLMGCVREYKKTSILTPILVSVEVIMECIIPFFIAKLINHIEGGADMKMILTYGGVLVLLAFVSLLFGALAGSTCATASAGFAKNLRHDLYYKVQDFSFSNIDKFSTSSLVTRLTTDVTNVQQAYMMIIRTAIRAPFMMIFAVIMAFAMCPQLSTVYVAIVPFLAFALFIIIKKSMPLFNSVFKKYDKLNNSVQENVKGMRVVKSFVREDYEKQKFNAAADDVCGDFTKAEKLVALNQPIMQIAMYVAMVVVSFLGAKLIINSGGSTMGVGELSSLFTYGMQILSSLMMVSMIFVMVTISNASIQRIYEVLKEESTIKNPENPVKTVADGSIDFDNVSFKYHSGAEKYALTDINLHIKSGETVGIIGGTGSSKTTLIQLISRLYDATEGSVSVGGVNVKDYDIESLRNEVSVVLQKNILFSGSIKDNLRWGDKNATDEEIVRVCKLAQADEFVNSFPDKYDTHIEQGGTNVSGGQKQRLCIARALLKKPKILILDDSTSAVDTKTDSLIRKAFSSEIPDTTKIIIAQRVSSVQDADRIIVMEDGRINAVGTHDELLKSNEIYKEVYYSQNKAGEE